MIWPKQTRYEVSPASEDVAMSDESMRQWIRVLDDLEAQLTENDPKALSWTPPQHLGDMPVELATAAPPTLQLTSAADLDLMD